MTPLDLDIAFVIEAGSTITLIGCDQNSGSQTAIQVELDVSEATLARAKAAGTAYAASGLSVQLAFSVDPTRKASLLETAND